LSADALYGQLRTVTVRLWYDRGMTTDKARENRARRAAQRQGFALRKSGTRDELALDYGWHVMRGHRKVAHLRDIGQLERWLADPASRDQDRKQADDQDE